MPAIRPTINTLDPGRLPPLLTVKQYAYILQMKEPAVRAQLRGGIIAGHKVGPRLWRIPREAVAEYLGGGQNAV